MTAITEPQASGVIALDYKKVMKYEKSFQLFFVE